uniref:2'-deoxynucleoside 5'-phosphate N-hydrolase 1 n=1 Tax=Xiphophorus couchianus TaxID=32473 RepID=A0A3B5LBF6_9TELE
SASPRLPPSSAGGRGGETGRWKELPQREEGPAGGDRAIHDRDLAWLQQSDVVVAEVTQPSLGVGYELGRAVDMKEKKVLCLFRPSSGRALSAMIRGATDGRRLLVVDYSEEQLEAVLDWERDPPGLGSGSGPATNAGLTSS